MGIVAKPLLETLPASLARNEYVWDSTLPPSNFPLLFVELKWYQFLAEFSMLVRKYFDMILLR